MSRRVRSPSTKKFSIALYVDCSKMIFRRGRVQFYEQGQAKALFEGIIVHFTNSEHEHTRKKGEEQDGLDLLPCNSPSCGSSG